MLEHRNTGAILQYPCIIKSWKDDRLPKHCAIMQRRPDVYCPVYSSGKSGGSWFIVMPQLQPHTEIVTSEVCASAMYKLKLLWGADREKTVASFREDYNRFIKSLNVPRELTHLVSDLYDGIADMAGSPATAIHGDATVQNIVHDDEAEAWWVDPSVRPAPLEREVDLGKLLMSLLGYDYLTPPLVEAVEELLYDNSGTAKLITYYCATHLARIWKDQTDRRHWILEVAEKLRKGAIQ